MKFMQLTQNTPEWYAWRQTGLGASDSTIITEAPVPWDNPKSPRQLWELKTGRVQPEESNYAQRRGSRLEATARELYYRQTGQVMEPCCVEHDSLSWLKASLDGLAEWGETILEIKAPRIESHEEALAGRVPDYYRSQLVHQCLVTGCRQVDYVSYSLKKGLPETKQLAIVRFAPSDAELHNLALALSRFWACVVFDFWPEALPAAAPQSIAS